ncbi:MAG: hypothetical protein JNK53_00980 [Phycisphaerae bacterium]|nr:hypothetical protein [Phycisphaerae bacterium]
MTLLFADLSNFFENAGLLTVGAFVGAVAASVCVVAWIKRRFILTKIPK